MFSAKYGLRKPLRMQLLEPAVVAVMSVKLGVNNTMTGKHGNIERDLNALAPYQHVCILSVSHTKSALAHLIL